MADPVQTSPGPAVPPGALVIDDDPMLLTLLRAVLAGEGFTVWTAETGSEGVELYRAHREQIAVVLLDVRMPGLDGPQTLTELRKIEPGVTCCFMSGHIG